MGQEYRYPDQENPPPVVGKDKMSFRGKVEVVLVLAAIGLYIVGQLLVEKFMR